MPRRTPSSSTTSLTDSQSSAAAQQAGVPPLLPPNYHLLTPLHSLRLHGSLGQGSFGRVYLAYSLSDNRKVAVKHVLRPDSVRDVQCHLEAYLHRLCAQNSGSQYVVDLYEAWKDPSTGDWWFVMEYAPHGDLFRYCVPPSLAKEGGHRVLELPVEERWDLFCDVVAAVSWCHSQGVAHLDLKCENILLFPDPKTGRLRAKLADFGLATILERTRVQGRGSSPYMSPELVLPASVAFRPWTTDDVCRLPAVDTKACDLWALGVMACNLATGMKPWGQATVQDEAFASVQRDSALILRDTIGMPDALCTVLSRFIFTGPAQRWSADTFLDWLMRAGPAVLDAEGDDCLWADPIDSLIQLHQAATACPPLAKLKDDSGVWSTTVSYIVW